MFQNTSGPPIICFDLETTGLIIKDNIPDIVQIGAVHIFNEDKCFEVCVVPAIQIHPIASRVNKFTTDLESLYREGRAVKALKQADGLRNFIKWLETFYEPVILVAHNCFKFDAKVMLYLYHNPKNIYSLN